MSSVFLGPSVYATCWCAFGRLRRLWPSLGTFATRFAGSERSSPGSCCYESSWFVSWEGFDSCPTNVSSLSFSFPLKSHFSCAPHLAWMQTRDTTENYKFSNSCPRIPAKEATDSVSLAQILPQASDSGRTGLQPQTQCTKLIMITDMLRLWVNFRHACSRC